MAWSRSSKYYFNSIFLYVLALLLLVWLWFQQNIFSTLRDGHSNSTSHPPEVKSSREEASFPSVVPELISLYVISSNESHSHPGTNDCALRNVVLIWLGLSLCHLLSAEAGGTVNTYGPPVISPALQKDTGCCYQKDTGQPTMASVLPNIWWFQDHFD